MNWYPEQLRIFALVAEKLSELDELIEKEAANLKYPGSTPYLKTGVLLEDSDGTDLGKFVDEIGGSWSWVPPGETSLGEDRFTFKIDAPSGSS
jgi:hypothetical protein